MKKTIELGVKHARLSNTEPFLTPVNDSLELEFVSAYYVLNDLVVCLKNGTKQGKYRVKGTSFVVPVGYFSAGSLEIGVNLMSQGEIVKHWDCTPITVKEFEGGFCATDALTALSHRVADLEKTAKKLDEIIVQLNKLATKHNELAEIVAAIKENY